MSYTKDPVTGEPNAGPHLGATAPYNVAHSCCTAQKKPRGATRRKKKKKSRKARGGALWCEQEELSLEVPSGHCIRPCKGGGSSAGKLGGRAERGRKERRTGSKEGEQDSRTMKNVLRRAKKHPSLIINKSI